MKVNEQSVLPLAALLKVKTLAGATAGREAAGKLQEAAMTMTSPLVLSFDHVELITASAFREAILSIVRWAADDGRACLLANVNEITCEEGLIAAAQSGSVLVFCSLDGLTINKVEVRGALDAKLEAALRLVLQLGEADAKAVSDASGEDTVTTAWNNRLVALTRMGLLAERKVGKTKYYSSIVKGMSYGK